jgi:hypothetical protein
MIALQIEADRRAHFHWLPATAAFRCLHKLPFTSLSRSFSLTFLLPLLLFSFTFTVHDSFQCDPGSPFPYGLGMLRVMTVRVKPQAVTEARFPEELIFRRILDEVDEPVVGVVLLPQHLGERQVPLPFRHPGVEGIDAAVGDGIPRWLSTVEDERKVRQGFLFPPGHVRDDVSD